MAMELANDIDRIKTSALWVKQNLGPKSEILGFGYNEESLQYLDQFMERQGSILRDGKDRLNYWVGHIGSFLGECIILNYGGKWQRNSDGQLAIAIHSGGQYHWVLPFNKVFKRIVNGKEDSIAPFFAEFLPAILDRPKEGSLLKRLL